MVQQSGNFDAMSADLVSIVTPAFNAVRFVAETIEGVRAQSYSNWELIIADDCSQDETCSVVERASESEPRIRLIRQKQNGGPSAARNTALHAAGGRFVAFLDSDDLWLPQKLERQLAFMKATDALLTFTEFRRMSENGERCGRVIRVPDRLNYGGLLCNTAIATSTVIVDRMKVGAFTMKRTYYDDYACWLSLLRPGGWALGLHEDLMRYRVVGKSVSRNKRNSAVEVWRIYRQVEGLGRLQSSWCFANYALRGWLKYLVF
jgi:teichuronic acid biosynthesis glycosyltransferase TuaG